jgi:guanylate kinase
MSRGAVPVVLAATSGTGKTTLARRLVDSSPAYVFSVSATTRPPRQGERDGVDYHFLPEEIFERRIREGAFAEWARVHGRLYGTPRSELDAAAVRGEHVVLDIDVQGASQIRRSVPGACLIFVLPPSVDIMMARLEGRGTEDRSEVARRLRSARDELQAASDFDYVVVNDDLDTCLAEIRAIVEDGVAPEAPELDAERFRTEIGHVLETRFGDITQNEEQEGR